MESFTECNLMSWPECMASECWSLEALIGSGAKWKFFR